MSCAVAIGRVAGVASRLSGHGGGTALPGLVADWLAPDALAYLTGQVGGGVVVVTGTNGKTTTSHLLREMLHRAGFATIHNASGSNLARGILGVLLTRADWRARLVGAQTGHANHRETIAVFETDEAAVPRVLREVHVRVLVVTNLFRDQLDRYGEVDIIRDRWREALNALPQERRPVLILNVDDPTVAGLGNDAPDTRVRRFGLTDPALGQDRPDHAADATRCPVCQQRLRYRRVTYAHLGDWTCADDHGRGVLTISADRVVQSEHGSSRFRLRSVDAEIDVVLPMPGTYNVYNAVAATAAAQALGVNLLDTGAVIGAFVGVFGRFERIVVGGRTIIMVLAKNPVGLNEALRALTFGDGPKGDLLLALNDLDADGRDVSWIWDADLEAIATHFERITVAGTRAEDLAVRLKYAGISVDPAGAHEVASPACWIADEPTNLGSALDQGLRRTAVGATLVAVVTYTAMLALRAELVRRGLVAPYWEDASAHGDPIATSPPTKLVTVSHDGDGVRNRTLAVDPHTSKPDHSAQAVGGAKSDRLDARDHVVRLDASAPGVRHTPIEVDPSGGFSGAGGIPHGRKLRAGHLYADQLNLYADRGNMIALAQRCAWRGIAWEVVPIGIGDRIPAGRFDFLFMGGGQDGDQAALADDLFRVKADDLRHAVADGVPLLAVCGSYQLLGHHYDAADGTRIAGLEIFDLHTVHPGPRVPRCVGNSVVDVSGWLPGARPTVVGFENHGGRTFLGREARPLARVMSGFGNNGTDRTEGIVLANAVGTYLHGSLLPKNPHFADRLIANALERRSGGALEPLDDRVEWRAHQTIVRRYGSTARTPF